MMLNLLGHDSGEGDHFDPAQDVQFGSRVAEPVEHHHTDQRLDINRVPSSPKHVAQAVESERIPQLG